MKLFGTCQDYSPARIKLCVLSGLTVALALVPEAIAFAFVAHVHPLVGLYAAFLVGLITAAFGGRPGMISGAAGSLAVVMVALVVTHGVEYLFATVVLMGVLQIAFGILKLGKFIRMVPFPVMIGFVNGLAVVIFLAQLGHFKTPDAAGNLAWMSGMGLYTMLGLVALTMAIIYLLPRVTRAIPSALAGIVVVSALVIFGGIDTKTVGDMASIKGGLPQFHLPSVPFTWEKDRFSLQSDPRRHRPDRIAAHVEPDRRDDRDARHAEPRMRGAGHGQRRDRFSRRYGRLRDDRPEHDQREQRRDAAPVRHHRRAVPVVLHPVLVELHRTDPDCRADRPDVRGVAKDLRLGQLERAASRA